MLLKLCTILFITAFAVLTAGYKDYKNYRLYSVVATSEQQQLLLLELSKHADFDFFKLSRKLNDANTVLVSAAKWQKFEYMLQQNNVNFSLLISDVAPLIAKQRQDNERKSVFNRLNVFERYYRPDEINDFIEELAQQYPTRAYVKVFGRSYEKRPLKIITITNGDGRTNKKIIFIDATTHAREWITPSMALHIIKELLENYEANAALLQDYDWVIMPVVNPDGYEYTHTEDRFWRKTRRPNVGYEDCVGTDPNRNFGYEWGHDVGSSSDPCSLAYRGEKPFSEPETQVVRDILWNYQNRMKFYLTLHSHGNMILLPWGYSSDVPDNFFDMMEVAEKGALAILFATNTVYSYGSSYAVIYPTSGDSTDYAVGALNLSVTATMELPGGGDMGFDPPVEEIEDIVIETWIGIKAMAEAVVDKY